MLRPFFSGMWICGKKLSPAAVCAPRRGGLVQTRADFGLAAAALAICPFLKSQRMAGVINSSLGAGGQPFIGLQEGGFADSPRPGDGTG